MFRFAILLFFSALSIGASAQRIAGFGLLTSESHVGLRFTITRGSSCSGYTVYHSLDSLHFSSIYEYAGVCGNSTADDQKTYTHAAPTPNRINYYKINLWPVEMSEVAGILVPAETVSGLLLYPNPQTGTEDRLTVRLLHGLSAHLDAVVCNQFGNTLQPLRLEAVNQTASIGTGHLANGVYSLRLNDGARSYVSKFVVLR